MSSSLLSLLEPPPAALRTPDLSRRLLAALADQLLAWVPVALCALGFLSATREGDQLFAVFAGAVWFAGITLAQWIRIGTTGQSFGKAFYGLRIVALDGSPAGWWRGVLLRTVLFNVLSAFASKLAILGTLLFLGDLAALLWTGQRALHDRLAGTRVVEV